MLKRVIGFPRKNISRGQIEPPDEVDAVFRGLPGPVARGNEQAQSPFAFIGRVAKCQKRHLRMHEAIGRGVVAGG